MKIVVACGGTGGHAFPGLAVAEELRRRGHTVVVWDSGRDIESAVMRSWSGDVFSTGAKPLRLGNAFAVLRSIWRCRRELRREKPDALLAMGSYSSLPPVLAARWCGVRVFLHEANTVPGKAVEFLSRFAEAVAISFAVTARYLTAAPMVHTGLPTRASIAGGKRFDFVPTDAFTVFVTGGSQGAHAVNELASAGLKFLKEELDRRPSLRRPLFVIHQTGAADEGRMAALYAACGQIARVQAFENEMADAFATADFVIARAGASTCFELAACAKPALLVPLPGSMRDHQHFNADAFAAHGAADEVRQDRISPRQLGRYLLQKYEHPEQLKKMAARMRELSTGDAAARVADLVDGSARG